MIENPLKQGFKEENNKNDEKKPTKTGDFEERKTQKKLIKIQAC